MGPQSRTPLHLVCWQVKSSCHRPRSSCRCSGRIWGSSKELLRRVRVPAGVNRVLGLPAAARLLLRSLPQLGLPAVARARRTWRRCAGPRRPSARPSAPVGGVGVVALAPHRKPRWSTSTSRCSTGDEYEMDGGGARTRHTPALARAQRSHPPPGPITVARAALRPPCALASPSPPLPCPRRAAPSMPSTPPPLRARSLGPRAR